MSKLSNYLVTGALAIGTLLVIWAFGSFTAVKILVILAAWFALLGVIALGLEMGTQALFRAFRKSR